MIVLIDLLTSENKSLKSPFNLYMFEMFCTADSSLGFLSLKHNNIICFQAIDFIF